MLRPVVGIAAALRRCSPARWLGVMPVLVFIASVLFYCSLFRAWNSAPVFTGSVIEAGSADVIDYAVDVCRITSSKIQVEAWVALRGHVRRSHESLLLARDPGTGEYLRLKTRVVLRSDVSNFLNERYGDAIDYSGIGLQGSLNYARGGRELPHGQIYAGYETERGHILVELPCEF